MSAGAKRGRPAARVYSMEEAAVMCDLPVRILRRHLMAPGAPFFPGAFERAGEWMIPEGAMRGFMGRKVEPHFSLREVAALLGLSYGTVYKRHWVVPAGVELAAVPACRIGTRLFFGEEIRVPESEVLRVSNGRSTKLNAA